VTTLQVYLNGSPGIALGVIGELIKTNRYGDTQDQIEYQRDIENVRSYFTLCLAQALIASEKLTLAMFNLRERECVATSPPTSTPTSAPTNFPTTRTSSPTSAPTDIAEFPTSSPTSAPTKKFVDDNIFVDENNKWKKIFGKKNCAWVEKKPSSRCKKKGLNEDNKIVRARQACKKACDNGGVDDNEWKVVNKRNCPWVAKRPISRCEAKGLNQKNEIVPAKQACRKTCGTVPGRERSLDETSAAIALYQEPGVIVHQEEEIENDARSLADVVTYDHQQGEGKACRTHFSTNGADGGPDSLVGLDIDNNKYFDRIQVSANQLNVCEAACTSKIWCKGIEYGVYQGEWSCELWKQTIGFRKSSEGFTCSIKTVTVVTSAPTQTPGPMSCNVFIKSNEYVNAFYQRTKEAVADMYRQGVPMVEMKKGAGIVHYKGEPWALSRETYFSGYYATVTSSFKGRLDKLLGGVPGMDLRTLFLNNDIPLDYIDQQSWQCIGLRQMGEDGDVGQVLSVSVMRVGPASIEYDKKYLESNRSWTKSQCESKLNELKSRSGTPSEGLDISTYYTGFCGDSCLCTLGELFDPESVQTKFYGRYYVYNLTTDDCTRMCNPNGCGGGVCGPSANGCLYCGDRRNADSRPSIQSYTAVKDYLRWDALP
jgi:hypothetical protein